MEAELWSVEKFDECGGWDGPEYVRIIEVYIPELKASVELSEFGEDTVRETIGSWDRPVEKKDVKMIKKITLTSDQVESIKKILEANRLKKTLMKELHANETVVGFRNVDNDHKYDELENSAWRLREKLQTGTNIQYYNQPNPSLLTEKMMAEIAELLDEMDAFTSFQTFDVERLNTLKKKIEKWD